jgi:hypothetical protein
MRVGFLVICTPIVPICTYIMVHNRPLFAAKDAALAAGFFNPERGIGLYTQPKSQAYYEKMGYIFPDEHSSRLLIKPSEVKKLCAFSSYDCNIILEPLAEHFPELFKLVKSKKSRR